MGAAAHQRTSDDERKSETLLHSPARAARRVDAVDAAMASASHYDVLGCRRASTGPELKKAFVKLALKHHPDRNADDTTAVMMRINAAYACLSDPVERARYDVLLQCGGG